MRIEKVISLVLSEDDVKKAIIEWLFKLSSYEVPIPHNGLEWRDYKFLAEHLKSNTSCIEVEGNEFVISIDGIYESENG